MPDQNLPTPTDQSVAVPQDQPIFPADQQQVQPVSDAQMPLQGQVMQQDPQQAQPALQPRPLAAMNALLTQAATQEDPLNPQYPTSSQREAAPIGGIEFTGELPTGVQSVEQLRSVEVSPEVEKYIEEVREDISHLPQEVVVADQRMTQSTMGYVAQPVIVLPMTEEEFDAAGKAPPTESRKWLHDWTERIMKMFGAGAVFRQ